MRRPMFHGLSLALSALLVFSALVCSMTPSSLALSQYSPLAGLLAAINVSLAFCMGTDYGVVLDSAQPMAQILYYGFGKKGTFAVWVVIIIAQYVMGTNMVRFTG